MEFPCGFHLVNLFVLLMQGPARNLHGISMEPPWKLHQNYIRVQDGTEELSKKGNMLRLLLLEITSNLHQNSMEPPWKLHQNYIRVQDGTEELSKKGNMLRLLLLEITSNLHQNSMESPWNLHESDHWNQQGKSAKNLHQNSMEPTSILTKMTTKALQKRSLKLLALFCHK